MDLSIDDGRPIFMMDGVNDCRVWIGIDLELDRLGVMPSCRNPDSADTKK